MFLSLTIAGLPAEPILLATVVLATIATTLATLFVVFFAWAPYVSSKWGEQFGVGTVRSQHSSEETH